MSLLLINAVLNKIIPSFGWMLIHSLWEGLFFAIITGTVLMLTKKSKAAHRYNLVLILFAAFIVSCVFTFIYEWDAAPSAALNPFIPRGGGGLVPASLFGGVYGLKQFLKIFTEYFEANEPLVVLIWFVFFLFKSIKMITCLLYNQQVKTRHIMEPPAYWAEKAASFSKKLQIKKAIRLLQSGYIKMPVVVGHLKPVILIPVGLMAGLPAEQVEAILMHELAHIRRNDYFVNFLQNITETIFFFNPGLLWISSLLREERENCCDDIAVHHTQNKTGFVQALISFKEHELYGSAYAVAFPGKKNYLLRRVSRIISNQNITFGLGEKVFFIGSILLLSSLLTAASISQIKENTIKAITGNRTSVSPLPSPALRRQNGPEISANTVKSVKTKVIVTGVKPVIEMAKGISGIKGSPNHVITNRRLIQPMPALYAKDRKKAQVVRQIAIELDRTSVSAYTNQDQVNRDREQAKIDQAQALKDQFEAAKDQVQARIDQAQALKDQAQAKEDQQRLKDRAQSQVNENRAQIARNDEQARINKVQVRRNQEQAARNQEQAKLNQMQDQKNQEQAARNQAQALQNQLQAQKNQEQAAKNKVSIQE